MMQKPQKVPERQAVRKYSGSGNLREAGHRSGNRIRHDPVPRRVREH